MEFEGTSYTDTQEVVIPATGHDYEFRSFVWTEDNTAASALFVCRHEETHTMTVDGVVTTETIPATCETVGKTVYKAAATYNGQTYTEMKEDTIPALGHEYELTGWTWSEDYSTAEAIFTCKHDEGHTINVSAEIKTTEEGGQNVYTATIEFEGKTYTDVRKTDVKVTEIKVTPETLSLAEGTTGQLAAEVLPENAFNKEIRWDSENESIATVDENGLGTAVSEGTVKIKAISAENEEIFGECTVTVTIDPVIRGYRFAHSASFRNNLTIYYYTPKEGLEGYENFRLEVKKQVHGTDGTISWKSYEITDYTDAVSNGTAYYKFDFSNIAAKEMGDELVAVLHCEKDGKEYITEEDTYSIRTYAYNRLSASDSETFKTLMVDMLNYGAAAQVNFRYNTQDLVNAQLSEEQKALGTADMPELNNCTNIIDKDGATASFKYGNVVFGSNIELKYYMDLAEVESLENVKLQLTYTTATGREEVTKIGSEAFGYDAGTKCYTAKLNAIAAKDLDSKVTAVILEGNTEISGVMEYSIESYAENRLKQSTSANFKALLEALMKYGFSAKRYKQNNNS